jgi:Xaa-Pro aminopeptidase
MGRALEPGFVMTVEPGIYFIPQLMDMWEEDNKCTDFINYDKLKSLRAAGGMRAEDNVLITADGYKVLGKPIPKTIDEIEAVCGS